MDKSVWMSFFAVVFLAMVPIVPKMMSFRIAVLRKLRLNWFADLHEKHFNGFVLAVRLILSALAIVLLVVGLS